MESAARQVNIVNEIADTRNMTQTRTPFAARFLLALAVALLLGTLCYIALDRTVQEGQRAGLLPADQPQVTEQAAVEPLPMHRIDAVPADQPLSAAEAKKSDDQSFLEALGVDGAGDFTQDQVVRLTEAGHLVCDGMTDGVPVSTMTGVLMAQYRLTGEEAMTLVNAAGWNLCR